MIPTARSMVCRCEISALSARWQMAETGSSRVLTASARSSGRSTLILDIWSSFPLVGHMGSTPDATPQSTHVTGQTAKQPETLAGMGELRLLRTDPRFGTSGPVRGGALEIVSR